MKKIILILAFLISIHLETNAQQENQFTTATYLTVSAKDNTFSKNMYSSGKNGPDKDYDFYLRKSKNHRIVGEGIALSGKDLLIASGSIGSIDAYGNYSDNNTPIADLLTIAGAFSGIVSIPFIIMAVQTNIKLNLYSATKKRVLVCRQM